MSEKKLQNKPTQPPSHPIKDLGLEEIIQLANKIGLEYAEKRKEAERLELLRTSIRAQIMNRLELTHSKVPEAKLKRLAEADAEYVQILEQIAQFRSDAEKLRVRYESYKSLFDARRTLISYKKVEMQIL